jgi:hypothetical protein
MAVRIKEASTLITVASRAEAALTVRAIRSRRPTQRLFGRRRCSEHDSDSYNAGSQQLFEEH